MLNKRPIAMLAIVILLVAAAFTIQAGTMPAPVSPPQLVAENQVRGPNTTAFDLQRVDQDVVREQQQMRLASTGQVDTRSQAGRDDQGWRPEQAKMLRGSATGFSPTGAQNRAVQQNPELDQPADPAGISGWYEQYYNANLRKYDRINR